MRAAALLLLLGIASAGPTGSVRGRVLDPDGKGVEWVTVTAHCVSTEKPLSRFAVVGKDGRFRIEGLPPGEYVLEVSPVGPPKREITLLPEVNDLLEQAQLVLNARGHPHRIVVEQGEEIEHDIRMPRKVPVTLAVERDGKPLANAPVRFLALGRDGSAVTTLGKKDDRRTDERGEITFPDVAEGAYGISLHVGEWDVRCGSVDVAGKEPVRMPVVLGSYQVRVRVVDARGKPVTRAEPGLSAAGWRDVWLKDSEPIASATGVYAVPCLREGKYEPRVIVDGVLETGEAFEVGPGSPDREVTVALPETGSLLVRVADRAGKPLSGVRVQVEHAEGVPILDYETDKKGEVRVGYLTVGTWVVSVAGAAGTREVAVRRFAEAKATLTR